MGFTAAVDDTEMIDPDPRALMRSATIADSLNVPLRLTSITLSKRASLISPMES